MTRGGGGGGGRADNRQNITINFPVSASSSRKKKTPITTPDFWLKEETGAIRFDGSNSPPRYRTPPSSFALPQWQLSHAVSRSELTDTVGPPTKTAAHQSQAPIHVGLQTWAAQLANSSAAARLVPLARLSYAAPGQ